MSDEPLGNTEHDAQGEKGKWIGVEDKKNRRMRKKAEFWVRTPRSHATCAELLALADPWRPLQITRQEFVLELAHAMLFDGTTH